MEIGQLKAFCKVVELGSFHEAARELHLSQPAISLKIKKLEESLGSVLLIRDNKSVALSHEGFVFLPYAEAVLRATEEARHSLREFNNLEKGKVIIGCSDTVAKYLLLPRIKSFIERYPNIDIQILNKTSEEIRERYEKGALDIAFLIGNHEEDHVESVWLEYKDCLLLPANHSLAKRKTIKLSQLFDDTLILLDKSTTSRKLFERDCIKASIQMKNVIEAGSVGVQEVMVESGLGLAVLPDYVCTKLDIKNLRVAELSELTTRKLVMLSKRRSRAEQVLVDHFRKC